MRVQFSSLVRGKSNPRTEFNGIEELSQSLAIIQRQPLIVKVVGEEEYEVISGERRHRAFALLEESGSCPEVWVELQDESVTPEQQQMHYLTDNESEPLTFMEKAYYYLKLTESNIPVSEISKHTTISTQSIFRALKLVKKGAPEILESIPERFSANFASEVVKRNPDDHTKQREEVEFALTAAAVEERHPTPKDLPITEGVKEEKEGPTGSVQETEIPEVDNEEVESDDEDSLSNQPVEIVESEEGEKGEPVEVPDPEAVERIKNAPDTNFDGSEVGLGNDGNTYDKAENRLVKIDKLLEELNPEVLNQDKLKALELLLDYCGGSQNIAAVKAFLLSPSMASQQADFETSFERCARCGGDHKGIPVFKFQNPFESGSGTPHTHWASCPETGDPILIKKG